MILLEEELLMPMENLTIVCKFHLSNPDISMAAADFQPQWTRERKRTELEPNRTRTDFLKIQSNRTGKVRFDSLSAMDIYQ